MISQKYDESISKKLKIYERICLMRKKMIAPVDYAGCDQHEESNNFCILLSLVLSSRTKDEAVYIAMKNLAKDIGLDPDKILKASDDEIAKCISGVNFNKAKVTYIKSMCKDIVEKYEGKIPNDPKKIMELKGVGQKTYSLYENKTSEMPSEIAVDTHIHRILQRWNWVKDSKTPDTTRKQIMEWLPIELRKDFNQIMVGFGQTLCGSRPRCQLCTANDICPVSLCKNIPIDIEEFGAVAQRIEKEQKTIPATFKGKKSFTIPVNDEFKKIVSEW